MGTFFDTTAPLGYNLCDCQPGLVGGDKMLYNVAQLLKETIGATRQHQIVGELHDLDEANPGAVPIVGKVTLLRTAAGVLARGKAKVELVQTCRRCLESSRNEVVFAFEEEFVPTFDILTGMHTELADEAEPELVIDEHHILDLTEVLRQYAIINGAGFGLCREDCRGLCPTCGASLNDGPCRCENAPGDPRLAALAGLLAPKPENDTD
jgi:uncharacterized protein